MRRGLEAAVGVPGVLRITAGNYGGKLGKHHFHLKHLLPDSTPSVPPAEPLVGT
jgi:hypothetical protein